MSISLQLGFADYEQTYAKKKTRRQIFLEQMEATLPWDLFLLTDGHISVETVMRSPLAPWGEAAVAVRSARTRAVSAVA